MEITTAKIQAFSKSKAGIIIIIVLALGLSFYGGMEYKAYQFRKALQSAFAPLQALSDSFNGNSPTVSTEKPKSVSYTDKAIGDEIALQNITLKATNADVKDTMTSTNMFAHPETAKAGATFLVATVDLTNTGKQNLSFSPEDYFIVMDDQGRQFTPTSAYDLYVDHDLSYTNLAPGIPTTGQMVYEVPTNATAYYLIASDKGSSQAYRIKLK